MPERERRPEPERDRPRRPDPDPDKERFDPYRDVDDIIDHEEDVFDKEDEERQ